MRLDRLLTLYFFRPLLKLKPVPKDPRVAILMYHSISEPEKGNKLHPYYETCTSPKVFAEHMKFLHDNNYQVISLEEAVALISTSRITSNVSRVPFHASRSDTQPSALSSQPSSLTQPFNDSTIRPKTYVVLTFDDGYCDFYTHAFPVLQEYGFPATVFLPTAFIGNKQKKFKGKDCLTWNEVRELYKYGVAFGSHTVTHPKLIDLRRDEIELELKKSKEDIEYHIGDPVKAFCYPFAFPEQDKRFVELMLSLIKKCGYNAGITTRIGLACVGDNILTIRRIPVNSLDNENLFFSKLNGAYNWIQKFQLVYKIIKGYVRNRRDVGVP